MKRGTGRVLVASEVLLALEVEGRGGAVPRRRTSSRLKAVRWRRRVGRWLAQSRLENGASVGRCEDGFVAIAANAMVDAGGVGHAAGAPAVFVVVRRAVLEVENVSARITHKAAAVAGAEVVGIAQVAAVTAGVVCVAYYRCAPSCFQRCLGCGGSCGRRGHRFDAVVGGCCDRCGELALVLTFVTRLAPPFLASKASACSFGRRLFDTALVGAVTSGCNGGAAATNKGGGYGSS